MINLSQQSDAVDLLGGYKPYDSVLLLKQIYREFLIEQSTNEHTEEVHVKINLHFLFILYLFIDINSSKTI